MTASDQTALPHERLLETAYRLFTRFGLHAIGVDRIVADAGVAKMTLYRHFRSKGELALAVLDRREELWTERWLVAAIEERAGTAEERLLAIFDVFAEWFNRDDFEGCLFINSLVESHDPTSAVGEASAQKRETVRRYVEELARGVRVANAEDFSRKWHLLMEGAIVSAMSGDRASAQRAKDVAALLLASERPGESR